MDSLLYVKSGFHSEVDEICTLLGYYTACSGNSLLTFQVNLSLSSSRVLMFQDNLSSPS